jgi:hypothetical protein
MEICSQIKLDGNGTARSAEFHPLPFHNIVLTRLKRDEATNHTLTVCIRNID